MKSRARILKRSVKIAVKLSVAASLALAPVTAFAESKKDLASDWPAQAARPFSEENVFQKYYRDLYSPFVDPVALVLLTGGTVSTLTLLATHRDFEDKVLMNAALARPLGDTSQFGDILGQMVPNVAYTLWFGGDYLFTKDPLAAYRAELMFRATLAATSMSTLLKYAVREPRPHNDHELTSFPSGHSTSIFAFATTVAAMHGRYWGGASYLLAMFVAFSRMNDDRHRLHDVVAGATIGSMYGLSVYQRMRNEKVPNLRSARAFDYEIIPIATNDGAMLGLSGSF